MAKICENICAKNVVILKFFLTLLHEQMKYQTGAVIMSNREILEMLLPAMVNAAVRAGAAIMQIHGHKDDYDISLKSDKTPITMADRQAHRVIREALGSTRIPILSEEGREMGYEERRNWELYWLVDPLDGTAEFIEGYNEFTVNIALMENNQCVGAVIYVPYFEKIYLAGSGYGASLKEGVAASADAAWSLEQILQGCKSLPLVEQAPHDHLRVAVSRLHYTPETEAHIDALRSSAPPCIGKPCLRSLSCCLAASMPPARLSPHSACVRNIGSSMPCTMAMIWCWMRKLIWNGPESPISTTIITSISMPQAMLQPLRCPAEFSMRARRQ